MRISIVGGGPAGMYFALLMKKLDPAHEIRIFERNGPDDTFGWGVVFSAKTQSALRDRDPETYRAMCDAAETWDNVDVNHGGRKLSIHGNNFAGVSRLALLKILQRRCLDLGVDLRFRTNVPDAATAQAGWTGGCDLLVAADGINSALRRELEEAFEPSLDPRKNRYIWLGTRQLFHGLTLTFRETPEGLFTAHSYKFSKTMSTFIVECAEETWEAAKLDELPEAEALRYLESVFQKELGGQPLLSNNSRWIRFVIVKNRQWVHKNVVLLGDAAHTAHFSIGSGTKLAIEDSIALAGCLSATPDVRAALLEFDRTRRPIVDAYQEVAKTSLVWFEEVKELLQLPPLAFAYRLMTRSGKVDHENLRKRDPEFIAAYEREAASGGSNDRTIE